ncbi:MAG: hypothetical protein R3B95_11675 [Nitrospirales bacterium]|nr:hypothetical protein [Nitrospirales bacterium]
MSYTKGPWKVVDGRSIETADGRRIAHNFYRRLAGSSQTIPIEEVFGNALLMGAAPDMVEALEALVSCLIERDATKGGVSQESVYMVQGPIQEAFTKAKAALAKAKGKSLCEILVTDN